VTDPALPATGGAGGRGPDRLAAAVAAAVSGGVDWVQIRDRSLPGKDLLELADKVIRAARSAAEARGGTLRVLVNRRLDVALAAGADGVHLGFDAMDPRQARALLGAGGLVGVSAHGVAEVRAAALAGADYVHLAPIFAPLSKTSSRPPLGLEVLGAARTAGLPVLAQGGIDPEHAGAALAAGAAGAAVTGAILGAPDPARAARALRTALDAASEKTR
jgi:thiamine-phosphate pyrophosphorylase